jgi:outer membrane murein-binding lipoprotein Lpp
MMRAEKDMSQKESEAQRKQADVDQARQRLDDCRAKASPDQSSPCSSEESNLRSKQSSLDSARSAVERERSDVERMRSDVQRAKESRERARTDRDRKNQELLKEPEQIAVDKYCPHSYAVEQHAVNAKVTLTLSMSELVGAKSIVSDQPFKYASQAADETFPAQQGRCAQVASGDPLQLPDEKALRKDLMTKVVKDLRSKIMASYDAYRRGFLAAARRDESSGLNEEAAESYVRYVLTGPHALDDKKKLSDFFNKTKGIGKLDSLWSN